MSDGPEAATNEAPPAVSVILCVYNGARTIAASIGSVLGQTWRDFELLVINDGSTDDTAAVVAGLAEPRLRLISLENRGLPASRNRGLPLARGEFIAFIDADDLWLPDKLEKQVAALRRAPAAALAYSWTDCIDDQGRFLKHGSHLRVDGPVYETLLTRNFLDNGSSMLVRRELLVAAGPFDESLWGGEDWDMWLRLGHRYRFVCVPEVQVLYVVHGQSMSARIEQQLQDCRTVLARGIGRLPLSANRDRLRRTGEANMFKYTAVRLIETARDRRSGRLALRYWWQFVRTTPTPLAHLPKAVLIAAAGSAVALLPPPLLAAVRGGIAALRSQRWRRVTPGLTRA